jgi:hypothetical protein
MSRQVARDFGVDLSTFEEPHVSFDPSGIEPTWRVSYQGKQAPSGSHIDVLVGDSSKRTRFMVPPNTSLERTRDR